MYCIHTVLQKDINQTPGQAVAQENMENRHLKSVRREAMKPYISNQLPIICGHKTITKT